MQTRHSPKRVEDRQDHQARGGGAGGGGGGGGGFEPHLSPYEQMQHGGIGPAAKRGGRSDAHAGRVRHEIGVQLVGHLFVCTRL